jgi:hypothetical protein
MAESLDILMELRDMFSGMQALLEDPEKPASTAELKTLKANTAELTHIVEREIHSVVILARVLREQEGAMGEKTEMTEH